jgi:ABC-2 type transport system permease protein
VSAPISNPHVQRTFGFTTHARQTCAIAWASFGTIAKSGGGLVLLAIALFMAVFVLRLMHSMEVPLLPRTAQVVRLLTTPFAENPAPPLMLLPLLIIFCAGELVWRERDSGLSEMIDATPVPEWVFFVGKFLGLSLLLVAWTALLTMAGVLVQVGMGYFDLEIGLYLKTLFGLQLIDNLLFALLFFVVHAVVNQKHVGSLVALIAYGVITFASRLGIEHDLLVFGSSPKWSYTDIRGFGSSLGPWLWFKLYWAAWALLLAVAARLLWPRGRDQSLRTRLRSARRRFTRPAAGVATIAIAFALAVGGFIFYNTYVVNAHDTAAFRTERSVEYERRYGKYARIPQLSLAGSSVHVEIYPRRREVQIRGTYSLVNRNAVAIDHIHLATVPGLETGEVAFDRPAARVLADDDLGYRIYKVESALRPGESLRLNFQVRFKPRGFGGSDIDDSVAANGTYFTSREWLPSIGYQRDRELVDAAARKRHGLPPRPVLPSLNDAYERRSGADRVAFEAIMGTDDDQIAVAPGALRRTWTDGGRRYFHYSTDAPIGNNYVFASAAYAVHEAHWNPSTGGGPGVTIRIFHHPRHAANLDRMVRSVRASLGYYAEQFGSTYPYGHLTLIERSGQGDSLHSEASAIDYEEKFSLFNPNDGPQGLDIVFFAVAHEVAHQWWGHRLVPANVEGVVLMAEGLANYSAMQVLEATYGHDHLERYLSQVLWESYEVPHTRAAVPLLRADNAFLGYRKGAQAMYGLSRYIGKERVNRALQRLFEKNSSGAPPLPTTLDLYRELRAVTPDSLYSLLHDLFEANTFWDLGTEQATAVQTRAGTWQVTLHVKARKVVVDEAGVETAVPMNDRVEIGVFTGDEKGENSGNPLYLQKHRIRSGKQTITVTVPGKPARAGIDPYHLLVEWKSDNNIEKIKVKS